MSKLLSIIKRLLLRLPITHLVMKSLRNRTRRSFGRVRGILRQSNAIEIGGPSPVFARNGPFPAYPELANLDNVNFSEDNFWSDIRGGNNFKYDAEKLPGRQIISDAVDLSAIPSCSYDVLFSSHAIEHIANPIKALAEWKRIIRPGGHIILVAPDMRFTYDRKRPVTAIEHIVADFENDVGEDDATHFEEIITLHDLSNDGSATNFEDHVARTRDNARQKIAHHHVFDIQLLKKLFKVVGFQPILTDVFRPYHLLAVGRKMHEENRAG